MTRDAGDSIHWEFRRIWAWEEARYVADGWIISYDTKLRFCSIRKTASRRLDSGMPSSTLKREPRVRYGKTPRAVIVGAKIKRPRRDKSGVRTRIRMRASASGVFPV